jgi:hypothetical protein
VARNGRRSGEPVTAARTVEAVVAAIGELLGTYTAQECANYFIHAGYE